MTDGATLAATSALVSLYWAVGGTALLDTVGGDLERAARAGGPEVVVLAGGVGVAKLVAAGLALALLVTADASCGGARSPGRSC